MEMHSILMLLSILSIIVLLTFFIHAKQKKQTKKTVYKQEPRFDIAFDTAPNSITSSYTPPDRELDDEILSREEPVNLLADDPLLAPKATMKKPEPDPSKKQKSSTEEIIYLTIAAKPNKPYVGYELLQALLAAGLRFGAMNIFHRHQDTNGNGKILFSIASASELGTFEINKMGAYSGKGLVMFLRLSNNKDLALAFETMIETAKQLVEDLDGDILDNERKPLTSENIEKLRKRVLEFEQKQLIGDLFDQ